MKMSTFLGKYITDVVRQFGTESRQCTRVEQHIYLWTFV